MSLESFRRACQLVVWAVVAAQFSFGAGNPILLIGSGNNQFSYYNSEILRGEGLNAFDTADLASVNGTTLSTYDVVILGQVTLTSDQVTMFTTWVNGGGNLSNGYLRVNTSSAPGSGIMGETIQFHDTADLYLPSGASIIATPYSNAGAATPYPAVALRTGISTGGGAPEFTYDVSSSVVYTRQCNSAAAGAASVMNSTKTHPGSWDVLDEDPVSFGLAVLSDDKHPYRMSREILAECLDLNSLQSQRGL